MEILRRINPTVAYLARDCRCIKRGLMGFPRLSCCNTSERSSVGTSAVADHTAFYKDAFQCSGTLKSCNLDERF